MGVGLGGGASKATDYNFSAISHADLLQLVEFPCARTAIAGLLAKLGGGHWPYLWAGLLVHNLQTCTAFRNFILQRPDLDSGEPCRLLLVATLFGAMLQAALWLWLNFVTRLFLLQQDPVQPVQCAMCSTLTDIGALRVLCPCMKGPMTLAHRCACRKACMRWRSACIGLMDRAPVLPIHQLSPLIGV